MRLISSVAGQSASLMLRKSPVRAGGAADIVDADVNAVTGLRDQRGWSSGPGQVHQRDLCVARLCEFVKFGRTLSGACDDVAHWLPARGRSQAGFPCLAYPTSRRYRDLHSHHPAVAIGKALALAAAASHNPSPHANNIVSGKSASKDAGDRLEPYVACAARPPCATRPGSGRTVKTGGGGVWGFRRGWR